MSWVRYLDRSTAVFLGPGWRPSVMTSAASLLTSSFRVVSDGSADVAAKQMTYLAFSFLVIIYSNAGMVGSREDLLDPQTPRARDSRENRKLHMQVLAAAKHTAGVRGNSPSPCRRCSGKGLYCKRQQRIRRPCCRYGRRPIASETFLQRYVLQTLGLIFLASNRGDC